MKNIIALIILLSSTFSSFALVTNKVEWIRNEIAQKTPKTEIEYLGNKMIYQIGGEHVSMRHAGMDSTNQHHTNKRASSA